MATPRPLSAFAQAALHGTQRFTPTGDTDAPSYPDSESGAADAAGDMFAAEAKTVGAEEAEQAPSRTHPAFRGTPIGSVQQPQAAKPSSSGAVHSSAPMFAAPADPLPANAATDMSAAKSQQLQQETASRGLSYKNRLMKLTDKDEAASAELESMYSDREAMEADMEALTAKADVAMGLLDGWEGKVRSAESNIKNFRERAVASEAGYKAGLKRMKEIMEKRKQIRAETKALQHQVHTHRQNRSMPNPALDAQRAENLKVRQQADETMNRIAVKREAAAELERKIVAKQSAAAKTHEQIRDTEKECTALESEVTRFEEQRKEAERKTTLNGEEALTGTKDELQKQLSALTLDVAGGIEKEQTALAKRDEVNAELQRKRKAMQQLSDANQALRTQIADEQAAQDKVRQDVATADSVPELRRARSQLVEMRSGCRERRQNVAGQREQIQAAGRKLAAAATHVKVLIEEMKKAAGELDSERRAWNQSKIELADQQKEGKEADAAKVKAEKERDKAKVTRRETKKAIDARKDAENIKINETNMEGSKAKAELETNERARKAKQTPEEKSKCADVDKCIAQLANQRFVWGKAEVLRRLTGTTAALGSAPAEVAAATAPPSAPSAAEVLASAAGRKAKKEKKKTRRRR